MATEDVTSITRGTEWVSLEESVAAGMEKRTEVFVDYDTWYWQLPEQLTAAIRSGVQQGMRKFCYSCASENGRLGTYVQEDSTPTNWSRYELCLEAMTQRNLDNGTIRKVRIVMHDVEPSDVLPPGGEIQIKVHYGSNWWRIPSRMLQVRRAHSNGGKIAIAEHGAHPRRVAPPPPRAPMNLCAWDPYS